MCFDVGKETAGRMGIHPWSSTKWSTTLVINHNGVKTSLKVQRAELTETAPAPVAALEGSKHPANTTHNWPTTAHATPSCLAILATVSNCPDQCKGSPFIFHPQAAPALVCLCPTIYLYFSQLVHELHPFYHQAMIKDQ
jgi:hypothetical protein